MNGGLHDFHHLGSDQFSMGSLGVTGGFDLSLGSLGESNGEKTDLEAIGGLGLHESLDNGVPFLDHGASLISGDVHTSEVGIAVESLDLIDLELELSPGLWLRLVVAVSERCGDNTTSERISGDFLSSGLVTWGKGNASLVEAWGEYIVPLFSREWVATIGKVVRYKQSR